MASHQPGWAPAQSTAVLGFAAMAAVGATGLATVPAQAAVNSSARGTLLVAQEHESAPAVRTDPGTALADRIRAQAVQQRSSAEDTARLQAAQVAAAKRVQAQQIAEQAQAEQAAAHAQARARAAEAAVQAAARAEAQAQAEAHAQAEAAQALAEAQAAGTAARAAEPGIGTLVAPVAASVPGAGFGESDSFWAHLHTGQDFAAPTGTPVVAIGDGGITSAGWAGANGYRIVQTLADGTELWYCHLSAIGVGAGQVTAGQPIGRVGATGSNVTEPHLHLEVRPGGGEPVDPSAWLAEHGLAV